MPHSIDNIDLDFLSDTERDLILEVLRRDEELRQAEEQRIRKRKAELLEIKRKGAKRGSRRYSQRSCARCHGSMSLLVFNSDHCQRCHHLVCSKCRASLPNGSWLCRVCIKESDLRKTTGDWFYNLRVNRFSTMPGHELVRSSLRKRPTAKKYVTMGDVLLKHSESTRGPPVPVPRQKVNTTNIRENSDSIISTASSETKGDEFLHHGPSSEYSGSVASTVSYERKGVDSLFKSLQSDTESAEVASLTSGKTGTESGRVTPDLPRRAILPPHYNQSHGSSVTPPVNDGLDVCEQPDSDEVPGEVKSQFVQGLDSQVPEIKQASPNLEFDVEKHLEKSVKHIENTPECVKDELGVYDQFHLYESLDDFKSQFVQDLDTHLPEIKQASPSPEFDVDELFKKNIDNPPECVNNEMDVCDEYHLYETLLDIERQSVQGLDTQVPEKKQASPSPEFDVDELFKKSVKPIENPFEFDKYPLDVSEQADLHEVPMGIKRQLCRGLEAEVPEIKLASLNPGLDVANFSRMSVKHIEKPPECDKYGMDVSDQPDSYEVPVDRQFIQDFEMQVPEIKQACLNLGFGVENIYRMSVKHIESPPECVKHGLDVCDQPDSYEVPVAAKRQFVHALDMQVIRSVPEIKRDSSSSYFDVDKLFRKSVRNAENPPEHVNCELDDQSQLYQNLADTRSQFDQGLTIKVTEIRQVSPSPEFDVENLLEKHVTNTENPPECVKYGPDVCDQPDAIPVPAPRQLVQGLSKQVPEIKRASSSPALDGDKLFKKSVTKSVKCELDICDQADAFEILRDVESQSVQSLDTQAPEKKPVSPSPELDVRTLFKKSIRRTQNPPEHRSTLDLRENQDMLTVPMGDRSHSVPELDMQDDEEDIDSLVNFHRNSMVSSASSMSMTSIYSDSGDGYSMDVRGEVVFSMFYDESSQSLQVLIKECHKLACGDSLRQFSNPYVKCYLLPDKSRQSKRKTTIKRHTCNPVYEETFKYPIRRNQLLTRSMLISVWHHGHLTSNPFLGEVEIALDCYDLDSPQEECMALMTKAPCCVPTSAFTQFKGELAISLKYVPPKGPPLQKFKGKKVVEVKSGELHILIKEAKNLMAMKGGGMSDSFVKGYLFPSKSKTNKRKTPVVKKNLNPHYGHTFVYKELTLEQLRTMCLELTVWDREPMLSNEFLGGVRLSSGEGTVKIGNDEVGMDSVGEEVSLWQKMMQYPDSWAEGTLPLRTTMKKKGK
ncbi:synaptotagmin-like protein 4 isoform X2 [Syngnathus typhle]|uniref:synaptotagmin-like protein 4 isoform X2 n=1 Tax=Syngnathus typhle TaxID=161592 RepID=UPI002A69C1E1|nr:synaptotagmin-like protein 4 isoform X2 [Syngnathus typhle]